MNIEIIVSTINNDISNIDSSLLLEGISTIINQKPNLIDGSQKIFFQNGVKWIDYDQKGLSRSRNLGLNISKADFLYLTDDDVVLDDEFMKIISTITDENPDVDIFAFQVNGINKEFKKYGNKEKNINYLNSMRISSVQLIVKNDFIKRSNIKYDNDFGSGSKYKMGEENIFLFDALKKSAKIRYFPIEIAKVHIGESSWFSGFNEKYFFDRGAIFYRMLGKIALFYALIFCIRKYSLYKEDVSLYKAYKYMFRGMRNYHKYKNKIINKT